MTNLERIKQMNAEELAEFLRHFVMCDYCTLDCSNHKTDCTIGFKVWLDSEVDE